MLETIRTRRSIRTFTAQPVDDDTIDTIIEMGTWAPSGLNNQPWKFVVIKERRLLEQLAELTSSSHIIRHAAVCIAVFLDHTLGYDRVKDILGVGACIENMMLSIHALELGGVWLGEILKNRKKVEALLEVPESCELMAVVAFGHPAAKRETGVRRPLRSAILSRK
ncbi:MAG TPA: nitroreductase [Thermodesulfobacteriota bacterium]|nr:nitroreductase [Deltaproteobacteria bacterium]HNU72904.1 nitroreductase [Thermodesulfobacteriota bacterium]HOC38268.1 nitroreductase [Thermodesulfobacteriota bacterium]HQO77997.1 nitroreductase [Thermodesulfobacteriota bacterium]